MAVTPHICHSGPLGEVIASAVLSSLSVSGTHKLLSTALVTTSPSGLEWQTGDNSIPQCMPSSPALQLEALMIE